MKRCLTLCLALWMMLCSCAVGQGELGTDLTTPSTSTTQTTTLTENVDTSETPTKPTDTVETSATENDTVTEPVAEPSVDEIIASYGEWFLSPITASAGLKRIDVPAEYENLILKTPVTVTEVHGSFEYTIEFFKETYRFGEGLQARVTVKNITGETAWYGYHHAGCGILGGEVRSPIRFRTDQGSYKTMNVTPMETKPQEALTFEYLFYVSPGYFPEEGTYTFAFEVIGVPLEVIAN